MEISNIIDQMGTLVNTSKSVPVTGSIMVEKKKMMELVDQLRLAIPREVKAAEEILGHKDSIINQAITDARRTKTKAEDEYRERLDKNEMVVQSKKRAEEILHDAERQATKMVQQAEAEAHARRNEADAYALQSLRVLERELNTLSVSVRKGIDLLAGSAAFSSDNGKR